MNKNASPPRKNREKSYKYLLASLQLCEALGLESYNIGYYLFFYLSFICLIFMPKTQTIYHKISTGRSIAFISENINKAHMATRTVTVVLKNVVQPCRCPFTQGWFFWTHRKEQKMSSAPSFPIWLASLPRLKIRRELASVLTLVSRYSLLFPILTK